MHLTMSSFLDGSSFVCHTHRSRTINAKWDTMKQAHSLWCVCCARIVQEHGIYFAFVCIYIFDDTVTVTFKIHDAPHFNVYLTIRLEHNGILECVLKWPIFSRNAMFTTYNLFHFFSLSLPFVHVLCNIKLFIVAFINNIAIHRLQLIYAQFTFSHTYTFSSRLRRIIEMHFNYC